MVFGWRLLFDGLLMLLVNVKRVYLLIGLVMLNRSNRLLLLLFFELGHFFQYLLFEAKKVGQVRKANRVLGRIDGLLAE